MYPQLQAFIRQYVTFTPEEWQHAAPMFRPVHLPKGEYFIDYGQVARHIAFTQAGYLRVYYVTQGREITRDITPLHSFATALPSYVKQTPSVEIISAATDCDLLLIAKKDLDTLYHTNPKWLELGRRVVEEMFVQAQMRLYAFITQSAEVRYRDLMTTYPDILREVPLQFVASYLGITQQSLSRLRRKIAKEQF